MELTKDFYELTFEDRENVTGGEWDWRKKGYGAAMAWLNFWGGVGEKAYDILH